MSTHVYTCPYCDLTLSSEDKKCPHCGVHVWIYDNENPNDKQIYAKCCTYGLAVGSGFNDHRGIPMGPVYGSVCIICGYDNSNRHKKHI